ncbi:hypothetical protein [Alteromonas sp. a30]|uniref:hypothetical protein n=1 Tax=Alteromonas sp. a30 TaxID=2730917 RepID=UPI00227F0FD9|nr:hypothetical protein [Alteromonas sp. a30]MCY7297448.1 hypothetical protein [Alteromonas sp. a30]
MSKAYLKIYGDGNYDAEHAEVFLFRITTCYKSILLLDKILQAAIGGRIASIYPNPVMPYISSEDDRLHISSVEFHSPGFWEFLGKLNPLEVIRQYLTDRHEREKDNNYRNKHEEIKLNLENRIRSLEYVSKVVNTLRDAGVPEKQISMLVQEHIVLPLASLDLMCESGYVKNVELAKPKKESVFDETEI